MVTKIGIISGAGPMAGVKLQQLIIQKQQDLGCVNDDEFMGMVVHHRPFVGTSNTMIDMPDYVFTQLQSSCQLLQNAGCDEIVIACNSLYVYQPSLQAMGYCVGDFPRWAVERLLDKLIDRKDNKVVVLGSAATRKEKLYENLFSQYGISTVAVSDEIQYKLDQIIADVMDGQQLSFANKALWNIIHGTEEFNELIFFACTEFGLLADAEMYCDSLDLLADYVLRQEV